MSDSIIFGVGCFVFGIALASTFAVLIGTDGTMSGSRAEPQESLRKRNPAEISTSGGRAGTKRIGSADEPSSGSKKAAERVH